MTVKPAKYVIKVRNSSMKLIGQVRPTQMQINKRYNMPSSWVMTLGSDDPLGPSLAQRGSGIYVLRNGAYYFSGPTRYFQRKGISEKTITVKGYDDLGWVMDRQAYPVTNAPYQGFLGFNLLLRAYTFGDTSGTTAVDFGPLAQNGTYHGGFTLNQASLIDEPATPSTLLNGSTGYISVPTSGLPVNNQAFSMLLWFDYTGAPASTAVGGFIGTPSTSSCAYMGILSSGKPTMQLKGTNFSAANALTVGPHVMQLVYDGTTAKLWIDNAVVATGTPGTCTIAYGSAAFGCIGAGASNFFGYDIQYGIIFQGALGNASLPGSDLDGDPWPEVYYFTGHSRFAAQTYDTETGPAESVIKTYVQYNAINGSAVTERAVPNLALEADAAQGSTVTYDARFEQLLDKQGGGLLQVLANAGGVGMKVDQSGTTLTFKVFVPTANTKAKFSKGLGNLADYDYTDDAQDIANAIVVAGGGTGPARSYGVAIDATSVSQWGRIEGFTNGGSSTDPSQLATQATSALDSAAEKTAFNCQIIETDGLQYIRDYNLGDQATVDVDGVTLTELIREVDVMLDAQGGETLNVIIGTPNFAQIRDAVSNYAKQTQQISTRVALLERV